MTAPAVAAARFGWACLLGAALGLWYDFLRPLRPKHTTTADFAFLFGTAWVWLILGFSVCQGDLRLGYCGGLIFGGLVWEWLAGRWLQPVFSGLWQGIGRIWGLCWLPLKKFSIFVKILFASAEKWVTIKCNNRQKNRRASGGRPYGRQEKPPAKRADKIPPKQAPDQSGGHCGYLVVYGGTADPSLGADGY